MNITLGTVQDVSVEWILQNVTESVDMRDGLDWAGIINMKMADHRTPGILESILEQGIREPVSIQTDGTYFMFGNGHHRFSLAVALCLDTIPVIFTDDWDAVYDITDCYHWEERSFKPIDLKASQELWQPLFKWMWW